MSKKQKTYTAEFKTKIVLELLADIKKHTKLEKNIFS